MRRCQSAGTIYDFIKLGFCWFLHVPDGPPKPWCVEEGHGLQQALIIWWKIEDVIEQPHKPRKTQDERALSHNESINDIF